MNERRQFSYFATVIFYAFTGHFAKIQAKGFTKLNYDKVEIEDTDKEGNKTTRIKKIYHFPQTASIDDDLMDLK
jgi:hypothetical protein